MLDLIPATCPFEAARCSADLTTFAILCRSLGYLQATYQVGLSPSYCSRGYWRPYLIKSGHCLLAVEARVRSLLANAVPAGAACKLNGKSRHVQRIPFNEAQVQDGR